MFQRIKKIFYNIHIGFFITIKSIEEYFTKTRIERRKLYKPRIKFYLLMVIFFYLTYSHFDYIMLVKSDWRSGIMIIHYDDGVTVGRNTYHWHERSRALSFMYSMFIAYSIYVFISLFFISVYKKIRRAQTTLFCMIFFYTIDDHWLFYKVEEAYICYTSVTAYAIYYWSMFWGMAFIEWMMDMEEEYDDGRLHNSDEAWDRGTTIDPNMWYNKQQSDEPQSKAYRLMLFEMSRTTEKQKWFTDTFGNYDDYGENPMHVGSRYNDHKKKMYPEIFKDLTADEESLWELKDECINTPSTILHAWWIPRHNIFKRRNDYYLHVEPKVVKYLEPILVFFQTIYAMVFTRLYFFRPKAVGLYSFYNPYFNVGKSYPKGNMYKGFSLGKRLYMQPYMVTKSFIINFVKSFSIFRIWNNLKWVMFHLKYYPKWLILRRRRSGNYDFFKPKLK